VRLQCKILDVPKSVYYDWVSSPFGKRQEQTKKLDQMIIKIFNEHHSRYGALRIYQELKVLGIPCTRARISYRMKCLNLVAKAAKKYKPQATDSNHNFNVADNLLQQNFSADKPNEKWVTDITYVPTNEGWLYLCVFMDLFSRSVIGWSMNDNMKSTLITDALTMALYRRKKPTDVIIHSDRGSQYCSYQYQKLLKDNQLIRSMSATGNCYDNAAMESFFHTLKVELIHNEKYETREIAKTSIVEYIECYYNRKRRHSSIDYMIPYEFESAAIA